MGMSLNQILHRFIWNGLGLIALAAPIAIGAVHWPARVTLAALAGAILLAYTLLAFRRGQRIRFDGYLIAGVLLAGTMAFQLLPLGDGLLASLSPRALASVDALRQMGYEVSGRISLQPVSTVQLLCLLATALCLYLVSFNVTYQERNGQKVLAMVGIAGATVAAITMVHFVTRADLILGFYSPDQGLPKSQLFFSTFVNNNNAAGFLNLSLFVLVGQWQKAEFGKTKGIYAVLVILTATASAAMMSRGGLVAMLMGGLLLGAMSRWTGKSRRNENHILTLFGLLFTVAALGIFMVLFNKVLGQVEDTRLFPIGEVEGKMRVWVDAWAAGAEYAKAGAGAGAFYAAFAPFNDIVSQASILHAENELIEPFVEYGRVVGLAVILVPVLLLWRRLGFARKEGYFSGALAGLFALGLQNVADFGLRVPGVALPAALTLGALSGAFAREQLKFSRWRFRMPALPMVPIAATLFLLLIVGLGWVRTHDSARIHRHLAVHMKAAVAGPESYETALASEILDVHGHESQTLALLGKRREMRDELVASQALYDRAVELCPLCISPRIGLARLALRNDDVPGMLRQLLLVAQRAPNRRSTVFQAVLAARAEPTEVVEAWQSDPELLYLFVRYLFDEQYQYWTEALIKATLQIVGPDVRLYNYLGLLYLRAGRLDGADQVATHLIGTYPENPYGFIVQGRVFIRQNRLTEALLMYEEALDRARGNDPELALEMMGLLARMRRWDRFEAIAAELRLSLGRAPRYRSQYHILMAVREEMRGEYFLALQELDQAEATSPFNIQVPLRKARLQLLLGRADKAVAEYRKALRIDPRSDEAAEGLKNLESSQVFEPAL